MPVFFYVYSRQKVKRDKIKALYRHLNVTGDIDLIDLDQFRLTKEPKKEVTIFEFYNGDSFNKTSGWCLQCHVFIFTFL